jgi:hypothetical protein
MLTAWAKADMFFSSNATKQHWSKPYFQSSQTYRIFCVGNKTFEKFIPHVRAKS